MMRTTIGLVGLVLLLGGCEQPQQDKTEPAQQQVEKTAPAPAIAGWYRERAAQQRKTVKIRAATFREAVRGLLDQPDAQRLATAREAWRGLYEAFNAARVALRVTAHYNAGLGERLHRADPVPILPGYIDGLSQWPDSGIVHDATVKLTRDSLLEQQGATAEGEASVGFQVIHFLLHGEPDAPRKASAYIVPEPAAPVPQDKASEGEQASQPSGDGSENGEGRDPGQAVHRAAVTEREAIQRRRQYLRVATRVLTRDLHVLATTDAPAPSAEHLIANLRPVLQRLIRLEGLAEADDVAGDYMAPDSRELAMSTLLASLRGWLDAGTPFMKVIRQRTESAQTLRDRMAAIKGAEDVEALQALHAELAAIGDRLGRKGGSK